MDKVKRFAKEDLVTSDGSNLGKRGLCERGSSGETILHLACFRGNKECIRWIAEEFPELINEGHIRKKRYLGETALHLAVVKSEIGDIDIVEFLVEKGAKVNGPLAIGTEFKNPYYEDRLNRDGTYRPLVRNREIEDRHNDRGRTYFGQTVLQFAAASGKDKILRYLVENEKDPADLTVADQYQNNVLHILAYHGYFKQFEYIKNRNEADIKAGKTTVNLMKQRNMDALTPLQMGASRGHVAVLDQIKENTFKFGKESTFRIPINEIDPLLEHEPHSILRETPSSVIELALMNDNKEIICHRVIDALLKWKWALYARQIFLARMAAAIFFTVVLTLSISLQPFTLSERKAYVGFQNTIRLVSEVLTWLIAFLLVILELRAFRLRYNQATDFLTQLNTHSPYNTIRIHSESSHSRNRDLQTENIVFGVTAMLAYLHLLSFANGFSTTGPLLVIFKRIVIDDLPRWLTLYFALTLGFAAAMFLQMQSTGITDWSTFLGSTVWIIRFLFNQGVYTDFWAASTPVVAQALFLVYSFVTVVLLLNVLIATLVETFNIVNRDSKRVWKVEFANLILDIDAHLSISDKQTYLPYIGWSEPTSPKSPQARNTPTTFTSIPTPRYFLYTERITSSGEKETVKLVVGSDSSGRRIEFVPFPHDKYWSGWSLWGGGGVGGRVEEEREDDELDDWTQVGDSEWEVTGVQAAPVANSSK
ncbi:ankyrin [Rhizoclosmatium globosum]|uniref:Ankyrin n=1 Tax=Rhizoclosmatium globosum TaxID=329046 RepID=A0A1Y2BA19_9FUNG|nr:ankyrin [Rhizoclosmatium globosum]|eukprot:ORY31546.1 ankyrin [Rhizoclosmatium globosum]